MITVAYVGFGVSVREYHIPYVENRDDVKVKYVFRREEDIAQNAAYEPFYPEIIFTTDFNQILNDEEVNLVVVNTPDQFHVSYAKQILNAGKHALIEKPFAPTAKEAREVFALAKEKGLICMPNQNRRFDADVLAVNEVRSIHHPGKADDYYDLEFYYGNSKATVNTSMCVMIDYPRFTVHGTKGSFTLPPVVHNSGKKKVVGRHKISRANAPEDRWGTLVYENENGERVTEKVPVGCAHYERIYDSLVDAIEHGKEKCVKDEEVIRVLEILEEATAVAKSHSPENR